MSASAMAKQSFATSSRLNVVARRVAGSSSTPAAFWNTAMSFAKKPPAKTNSNNTFTEVGRGQEVEGGLGGPRGKHVKKASGSSGHYKVPGMLEQRHTRAHFDESYPRQVRPRKGESHKHAPVSKDGASAQVPSIGTRPCVGRRPKMPQ